MLVGPSAEEHDAKYNLVGEVDHGVSLQDKLF
jgi:hypothetical protein